MFKEIKHNIIFIFEDCFNDIENKMTAWVQPCFIISIMFYYINWFFTQSYFQIMQIMSSISYIRRKKLYIIISRLLFFKLNYLYFPLNFFSSSVYNKNSIFEDGVILCKYFCAIIMFFDQVEYYCLITYFNNCWRSIALNAYNKKNILKMHFNFMIFVGVWGFPDIKNNNQW